MVTSNQSDIKAQFAAFSQDASLDLFLPKSSRFDISTLQDSSSESGPRISSRRNLFFDERASLILILKTTSNEQEIKSLLPSLEIVLAAHATDAVPQGSGNAASASGKHDLSSETIAAADLAEVVPTEKGHTYVVWKPKLHLSRPRVRLQRPAIYFTANLSISTNALNLSKRERVDYLKSFEPLPSNVLHPLRFDSSLSGTDIWLSEARITKVYPTAERTGDDVKPIRAATKRAFPIVPALLSRIRCSALPDAVMASLHLEISQLVPGSVVIKDVSLEMPAAEVESLKPLDASKETRAGDELILLYKLSRQSAEDPTPANVSNVSVTIHAHTTFARGENTELDIRWQTRLDLSQTATKPSYKWSRPLSTSSQSTHPRQSLQSPERPTRGHKKSVSVDMGRQKPSNVTNEFADLSSGKGVTFNFIAPPNATRDQDFELKVQCLNGSSRTRRFALVVLQPKRTSTSASKDQQNYSPLEDDKSGLIGSLVSAASLDQPDQQIPDALDLNPDVRIGPLRAHESFETEVKFRALKNGVLDLGTLRIVDLDTRQTVDVKELPDILAVSEREKEGTMTTE